MATQLNLKEIERKAFRSTYQDGLWDLYLGVIVMLMAIYIHRPADGYSPMNLILLLLSFVVAFSLFWAGKKFITLPRMGQVRFGAMRKQKKTTLAIILGLVIAVQIGIVGLTALGRAIPTLSAWVSDLFNTQNLELLAVAALGSLFVGPSMILVAHFTDFPRGYYIAILMSLAVFMMIYLNQPVYAILIGALIALPGIVLFVRFLRKYPLPPPTVTHG